MVFGYHVAEPNSYLVITGAGVDTVRIQKKALVFPFQKVTRISITPFEFSSQLHAMTSEKLKICLPVVFTIGPQDDLESLAKYSVLLTGDGNGHISRGTVPTNRDNVQRIVQGIIEGETRSVISNLTMMELFDKRSLYKKSVVENVQTELSQFGLYIYNASIKELQDLPGSQYFEFQSKKAHEGVQNQARVDVASARMLGEIGEAEKQGETKRKIAQINAQTALKETERKIEKAGADSQLKKREIEIERELRIERIQAERAAELKDSELQEGVQRRNALMELERQRATTVTKAKVAKESAQEDADAQLYQRSKEVEAAAFKETRSADLGLYRSQKEVDAAAFKESRGAEVATYRAQKEAEGESVKATKAAENSLYRAQKEAEAQFVARKNEAAGIKELAGAYQDMAKAFGGPDRLMQYLMLQSGLYEKLAQANAEAIRGLQPKINVWNTGGGGGAQDGAADATVTAPLRNIFQSLPPLFSQIHDQTGMSPPSWLVQTPAASEVERSDSAQDLAAALKKKKILDGN